MATAPTRRSAMSWLLLLVGLASARYACDTTDLVPYYPFCINVPDGVPDTAKLPTVLYLSGKVGFGVHLPS